MPNIRHFTDAVGKVGQGSEMKLIFLHLAQEFIACLDTLGRDAVNEERFSIAGQRLHLRKVRANFPEMPAARPFSFQRTLAESVCGGEQTVSAADQEEQLLLRAVRDGFKARNGSREGLPGPPWPALRTNMARVRDLVCPTRLTDSAA